MKRKIIAAILVILLLLPLTIGSTPARAVGTDLSGTIEEQIRAYADSIDQKDADSEAARIIAMHGILMGGKTLNADENHALTAVVMNAEFTQKTLSEGIARALDICQRIGIESFYSNTFWNWGSGNKYFFRSYRPTNDNVECAISKFDGNYSGTQNTYDSSMNWITGGANGYLTVEQIGCSDGYRTYQVDLEISDRFDFSAGSNADLSDDILALIGSALFREFDWVCSLSFQLTVPTKPCNHIGNQYH